MAARALLRLAAALTLVPTTAAALLRVAVGGASGSSDLMLQATWTRDTPPVAPCAQGYALRFAGDACDVLPPAAPEPSDDAAGGCGVVLVAQRGNCTFDTKMATAVRAGAAMLVVADTLLAGYAPARNATAASMSLRNPCIVSCDAGRGMVDARQLETQQVLDGLSGRCPAPADLKGRSCPTSLCAFSGHGLDQHEGRDIVQKLGGGSNGGEVGGSSGEREVCCVLDSPALEMFLPQSTANQSALPGLYLSLGFGQALEAVCAPNKEGAAASSGAASASRCVVYPVRGPLSPASAHAHTHMHTRTHSLAREQPWSCTCTAGPSAHAKGCMRMCIQRPYGSHVHAHVEAICIHTHSSGPAAQTADEAHSRWDGSAIFIWLLATSAAALAAHRAATIHHTADTHMQHGGRPQDAAEESQTLDAATAVGFLVMASTFLLLLYFLIRAGFNIVLLLLNVVFVFASAAANAQIAIGPLLSSLAPPAFSSYTFDVPCLASIDDITAPGTLHLASVLGAVTSFSVSLFWFTHRHAPWMWLLQDCLSVAICLLFVRTLRLPSLRLATLFLGLMFAYDVFMVFLSPLIFHTSIMMTVATAGEPTASVSTSGKCERTDGETMPMLMLIPRLNPEASLLEHIYPPPPEHHHGWAWRLSGAAGSFAMIGLGDIVLPALAIAYGRRIDLSLRPTPRRPSSPRTRPCRKCGGSSTRESSTPCHVASPMPRGQPLPATWPTLIPTPILALTPSAPLMAAFVGWPSAAWATFLARWWAMR